MTQTAALEERSEAARRDIAMRAAAMSLGETVSLLIRSPDHSAYSLADLEWMVVPALLNRQFLVVRSSTTDSAVPIPGAVILWATVADDLDALFRANPGTRYQLTVAQRTGGDHVWLTDLAGHDLLLREAIKRLSSTTFAGRRISYAQKQPDGTKSVIDVG